MIKLLSILDVNYDPGQEIAPLTEIIYSHPQISKFLLSQLEIKHSPKSLLHILQRLDNVPVELALGCLKDK
jgi:hypothetical protein